MSADASSRCLDRVDVRTQVFAIGPRTLVGTCGLQMVIPAVSAVVIDELDLTYRGRKEIVRWPRRRRRIVRRSGHNCVSRKKIATKAGIKCNQRRIVGRTVEGAIGTG